LIREYNLEEKTIVVDPEYPHYHDIIKSYLVRLSGGNDLSLTFQSIGKRNMAHLVANYSLRHKGSGRNVKLKEVLSLMLLLETTVFKYKKDRVLHEHLSFQSN
jgi:hypothetical protein